MESTSSPQQVATGLTLERKSSHDDSHNSSPSPRSEKSGEGGMLKLNLNATDMDDLAQEMQNLNDELEDDLELLEYQRSRSTPKIEIQEFEEDEEAQEFRMQQQHAKKEMFSQLYEHHLKGKYDNPKFYSIEEVEKHNSDLDCWTVIDGKVYDITPFISQHPGGRKILRGAGKESTEMFYKFHPSVKLEETLVAFLFQGFLRQTL